MVTTHETQTFSKDLLDNWLQRLIDTTKRNRLLNFRPSKRRHVFFECINYTELLKHIFDDRRELYLTVPGILESYSLENKKSCAVKLPKIDYFSRLRYLQSESKKILDETSINVLYLTLGFLEYPSLSGDITYRAPLLLIPVEIRNHWRYKSFEKTKKLMRKKQVQFPAISSIYLKDEDVIFNPALIYILENEYGIKLPELAASNTEEIIEYFFQIFYKLFERKGFTIDLECVIGFFTFHRFTIYQDLINHSDSVLSNPVFRQIAGSYTSKDSTQIIEENQLDTLELPIETFHIMDADSSQRKAILMAEEGESFVLQGPPGTGKSQTITNIIAECIANGKSVLFVSSKKAALDVVYNRLTDKGLEDYLLDLHNTKKIKKKDFYCELGNLLERKDSEYWQLNSNVNVQLSELEEIRVLLNNISNIMNTPFQPFNNSLFEIYGRLSQLELIPIIEFHQDVDSLSTEIFEQQQALLDEIPFHSDHIPTYFSSAWKFFKHSIYDNNIKRKLEDLVTTYKNTLPNFSYIWNRISNLLGLDISDQYLSVESFLLWKQYFNYCTNHRVNLPISWLLHPEIKEKGSEAFNIVEIKEKLERFKFLQEFLEKNYKIDVFELPLRQLVVYLKTKYNNWFKRFFKRKDYQLIQQSMVAHSKIGLFKKYNYSELLADIEYLVEYKEIELWKQEEENSIKQLFGSYYQGEETDWQRIHILFEKIQEKSIMVQKIVSDIKSIELEQRKHSQVSSENIGTYLALLNLSLLARFSRNISSSFITKLEDLYSDANQHFKEIREIISILDQFFIFDVPIRNMPFQDISKYLLNIQQTLNDAPSYIQFKRLADRIEISGFLSFLAEYVEKELPIADIKQSFEKQTLLGIQNYYELKYPLLKLQEHERSNLISNFNTMDLNSITLAPYRIHSLFSTNFFQPESWISKRIGETAFLLREAKKKRSHQPIRVAFRYAARKILELKPVILLSPLSVSHFLDPTLLTFDVTIFDEASQLRPEEALGAIIRSNSLIVVGDSKQMPPTSFFSATLDEMAEIEFNDETEEDSELDDTSTPIYAPSPQYTTESILESLNIANFPTHRLKFHYRSKHESLIAFSNSNFYDNNLVTFPSPLKTHKDFGIDLVYVSDGIYDRGRTRTNLKEAEKIVEIVKKILVSKPDASIGIVAFSQAQEQAIERKINKTLEKEDEFGQHIADLMEREEDPLFIKNLETVQGDERDIIIISIGYGRDDRGRFIKNFGPITQKGGERRFNVLISRARKKVIILTSVHPNDYPTKSKNKNFEIVRKYLMYALTKDTKYLETDHLIRHENITEKVRFIITVQEFLKKNGYETETDVGIAGTKIDLAVVHKETDSYVMAIECDGPNYNKAKTARDRDRIRKTILEKLGWVYYRIFSNIWIKNPTETKNNLLNAVKLSYENHTSRIENIDSELEVVQKSQYLVSIKKADPQSYATLLKRDYSTLDKQSLYYDKDYKQTHIPEAPSWLSLSKSYDKRSSDYVEWFELLKEQISIIINSEAPINRMILLRRVLEGWHTNRLTTKAKNNILQVLNTTNFFISGPYYKSGTFFYWKNEKQQKNWQELPIRNHSINNTPITQIAPEEIAKLMDSILQSCLSTTEKDLFDEVCNFYGKKLLSKSVNRHLKVSLNLLLNEKSIVLKYGYIRWEGKRIAPQITQMSSFIPINERKGIVPEVEIKTKANVVTTSKKSDITITTSVKTQAEKSKPRITFKKPSKISYHEVKLDYLSIPGTTDDWSLTRRFPKRSHYYERRKALLKKQVEKIISTEAPIHRETIQRKIIKIWHYPRLTQRAKYVTSEIINSLEDKFFISGLDIFWLDSGQYMNWTKMSFRDYSTQKIKLKLVPLEEIALSMMYVMIDKDSLSEDNLFSQTVTELGFKVNKATRNKNILKEALDILTTNPKMFILENDSVSWSSLYIKVKNYLNSDPLSGDTKGL